MPRKALRKKSVLQKIKTVSLPRIRKINKKLITGIVVTAILVLAYIFKGLFIAATVNGKPIPRLNVIRQLEKQGGKQVINTLITQELIVKEGKNKKITISQKEIDEEIKKVESNLSAQGVTLEDALKQEGMKKTDLYGEIKIQLMLRKLAGKVSVTDKEVDDYLTLSAQEQTDTTAEPPTRDQVKLTLEQEKLQQKIQDLIVSLKEKAKISYFVEY